MFNQQKYIKVSGFGSCLACLFMFSVITATGSVTYGQGGLPTKIEEPQRSVFLVNQLHLAGMPIMMVMMI